MDDDWVARIPGRRICFEMYRHVHLGWQWCERNVRIFERERETYLICVQTIETQRLWSCKDLSIPVIPLAGESVPVLLWNHHDSAVAISETRIAGQFV
jgi:hypothetical protein